MDDVLRKEELVALLKAQGLGDQEIEWFYEELKHAFKIAFLSEAYVALPESEQKVVSFGLKEENPKDIVALWKKTYSYLTLHQNSIDTAAVSERAAERVRDTIMRSVTSGGSYGRQTQ